jgi:uncharacterized delta-60 repeat protein
VLIKANRNRGPRPPASCAIVASARRALADPCPWRGPLLPSCVLPAASRSGGDRLAPAAGNLDLSFGNGTGFATTDFGTQSEGANAVALQSDGKVLAAGWTSTGGDDFAISRYLHNGSLNGQNTPQPFSFDGIVTTDFGGYERAFAILVQTDGKIVAVGNSTSQSLDSHWLALARYNSDGTLDLSFGPDGTGKVLAHSGARGIAAALQNDGKIVVVGTESEGHAFLVVRFTTDGLPDATFGSSGIVTVDFGPSGDVAAGAIQPRQADDRFQRSN